MSDSKIGVKVPRLAVGDRVTCWDRGDRGMAGLEQGVVYIVHYASDEFVEIKGICRIFKPADFYLAPQPEETSFKVGDSVMIANPEGVMGLEQGAIYIVNGGNKDKTFITINGFRGFFNPADFKLALQPKKPNDEQETLRDKFAMAALTGMLSYSHVNPSWGNYHENCTTEQVVNVAYTYADQMLKERNRK